MKKTTFLNLAPYLVVFTLIDLLSLHLPFFWDTIQLGYRHADFFYSTHFHSLILPKEIDSGHFPLFGIYLATIWSIFSKNIPLSHIFMLPFLLGICYQYYKLALKFIGPKYIHYSMLLLIADPLVLSQSTMVGPDIVLLFLFLACCNFLLEKRKWLYPVALCFLALVSMRGMITIAGLFLFENILSWLRREKLSFIIILKYIPAGLLACVWLVYHYQQTGWTGYYPGSSWAACFVPVPLAGVFRNIAILIWRLLDFGRVFVWLLAILCFIKALKLKENHDRSKFIPLALFLVILSIYVPSFILYQNLSAHRYLMPCMVLVGLCTVYYLQFVNLEKIKNIVFGMVLLGFFSGNFWVYPDGVSEGWDATLAHIPYFSLRKQMINYINNNHINPQEIGTAFPNVSGTEYTDMDSAIGPFKSFDLSKDKYIFQSNIFNDFKKPQIDSLKHFWTLKKEYKSCGVYARLYKR